MREHIRHLYIPSHCNKLYKIQHLNYILTHYNRVSGGDIDKEAGNE